VSGVIVTLSDSFSAFVLFVLLFTLANTAIVMVIGWLISERESWPPVSVIYSLILLALTIVNTLGVMESILKLWVWFIILLPITLLITFALLKAGWLITRKSWRLGRVFSIVWIITLLLIVAPILIKPFWDLEILWDVIEDIVLNFVKQLVFLSVTVALALAAGRATHFVLVRKGQRFRWIAKLLVYGASLSVLVLGWFAIVFMIPAWAVLFILPNAKNSGESWSFLPAIPYSYILRRLIQSAALLLIISVVLFVLMQASGDPLATLGGRQPPRAEDKARLRRQFGLDQPLQIQYVYWLLGNDWTTIDLDGDGPGDADGDGVGDRAGTRLGALRGDFGKSLKERRPVTDMILDRMPDTLILMGAAELLIITFSLFIGIYSAVRQYSVFDHVLTGFSFIMYSMPVFWIALMLIYIFAVKFKAWDLPSLPSTTIYDPIEGKTTAQMLKHIILPSLSISLISIAAYSRYIRASMLEVLNSDYIRTARAKGLKERRILLVHAFKNASLPIVTLIGLDIPLLLAGAVVTERIFSWPGMGRLFLDSLERSDYPVLMGLLMMVSSAVVIFQLVTDIVYTWLDPRIRYS
jgi:peptide/nickel transport system permease protein